MRAAIRLWFDDGDPVAVHTLAYASHEIIHRMFRQAGHRGLLFDSDKIRKEDRQKWAQAVKRHANFFKHAEHDLDEEIDFEPRTNLLLLSLSIEALRKIGEEPGMEESIFNLWVFLHHPELLGFKGIEHSPQIERVKELARREFWEAFSSLERRNWLRGLLRGAGPLHGPPPK